MGSKITQDMVGGGLKTLPISNRVKIDKSQKTFIVRSVKNKYFVLNKIGQKVSLFSSLLFSRIYFFQDSQNTPAFLTFNDFSIL